MQFLPSYMTGTSVVAFLYGYNFGTAVLLTVKCLRIVTLTKMLSLHFSGFNV